MADEVDTIMGETITTKETTTTAVEMVTTKVAMGVATAATTRYIRPTVTTKTMGTIPERSSLGPIQWGQSMNEQFCAAQGRGGQAGGSFGQGVYGQVGQGGRGQKRKEETGIFPGPQ